MAGEMFGSAIGHSQAEQDMARTALSEAQIGHMGAQDSMLPFTAAQHIANSRYLNSRADSLNAKSEAQRRIAQAAMGESFSDDEKRNPGWKLANIAMNVGAVDEAMTFATKAAGVDSKLASTETNAARQGLIQTRNRLAQMDELSRGMRLVDSPESLQSVLQNHERTTGEATGFLNQQGQLDPHAGENWEKLRDLIQSESLTEQQRLTAQYRTARLGQLDRDIKRKEENSAFWQDMDNQENRAAAQARGRGIKTGASALDKGDGVKLGTDYLTSQFSNVEPSQAKIFGRQINDRAKEIRDKNPALTPMEATRAAFDALDTGGKFDGMTRRPARADPNKPLPLPEDGKTENLKVGQYYTDGKNTREYLGPGKGDKGWGGPRTKGKISGTSSYIPDPGNEEDDEADAVDIENEE